MLEFNKHLANTKKALGRKMTLDEVKEARVNFRRLYGNLEDKSSFEDAYAEWKQCGTEPVKGAIQVYESSWGCGSRATPVAPEEFHAHIREYGWPSVEEVRDGGDGEAAVQPNDHTDFDAATRFSLFGIGREPRNLDRTGIGSPGQFNIIEKGFHNWLEFKIGKNLADSGTVMVMAHGPSAKRPGEYDSSVVQVSGVFYAPRSSTSPATSL